MKSAYRMMEARRGTGKPESAASGSTSVEWK